MHKDIHILFLRKDWLLSPHAVFNELHFFRLVRLFLLLFVFDLWKKKALYGIVNK